MPYLKTYDNADAAVINLLKCLSVNIDPSQIIEELSRHPDYPSLLAINDVLNLFGIDNAAYRVEPEYIANVPVPFIAHTRANEFVVVTQMSDELVTMTDHKKKNFKIPSENFKNLFGGVVLAAEPSLTGYGLAKSKASAQRAATYRYPVAVTMLTLVLAGILLSGGFFSGLTWQMASIALVKTAGIMVSVLLLVQSIDKNNPFVQALCGGGIGNNDCKAILTSNAAKVFDWLSWSEVGFFYFTGTWLSLLFAGGSVAMLQTLAILNLLSLPYTVYSIYYQGRVAKQWCRLCCAVQALLWLEFIPFVTLWKTPFVLPVYQELAKLLSCLLLPVALWMIVKPLILKAQQVLPLKRQLQKFKYNAVTFEKLLTDQPKYAIPDENWSIVLGNVEANNVIVMVSNPYCPPCAKTHKQLDELLQQNPNVQARIIFTALNTDDDIKTPVSRHLLSLNGLKDKALVRKALHDWYEQKQKSYESWARLYPVEQDEAAYQKLGRQKAWCDVADIKATPTLVLNGYQLPEGYLLPDLKYMLM